MYINFFYFHIKSEWKYFFSLYYDNNNKQFLGYCFQWFFFFFLDIYSVFIAFFLCDLEYNNFVGHTLSLRRCFFWSIFTDYLYFDNYFPGYLILYLTSANKDSKKILVSPLRYYFSYDNIVVLLFLSLFWL